MRYDFLNAITEPTFKAQAYEEYLHDCNENYAKLIALLSDISGDVDDESNVRSDYIGDKLAEYGFDGSESISLNSGYTTLAEICNTIRNQVNLYSDVENVEATDALTNPVLQLVSQTGANISGRLASFSDIVDGIRENFHASTVLEAALHSIGYGNATERLQIFKDAVESKFSNVYSDLSNTFTYYKDLITSNELSTSALLTNIFDSIGVTRQTESIAFVPDNADVYKYTGATPLPALNFSGALKVVGQVASVVAGVVASTVKAVGSLMNRVFSWIGAKVTQVVENPYDLKKLDNGSKSGLIDGWCINNYYENSGYSYFIQFPQDAPQAARQAVIQWTLSNNHHWFKYNTIFAEILFCWGSVEYTQWTSLGIGDLRIQIKPKSTNPYVMSELLKPIMDETSNTITDFYGFGCRTGYDGQSHYFGIDFTGVNGNFMVSHLLSWLESCANNNDIYYSIELDNENDVYMGFVNSLMMLKMVLATTVKGQTWGEILPFESSDTSLSNYIGYSVSPVFIDIDVSQLTVTNYHLVNIASGFDPIHNTFEIDGVFDVNKAGNTAIGNWVDNEVPGYGHSIDDVLIAACFFGLISQRYDRAINPTSYQFIAYRNNSMGFSEPQYYIATDEDNQAALTKFLTTVVIVSVVLLVATTSVILIKRLQRARAFKMTDFISKCDNQMWTSTEPLTNAQKRKYVRYSRKLAASRLFTGGMQATTASVVSSIATVGGDDNSTLFLKLQALICGNM